MDIPTGRTILPIRAAKFGSRTRITRAKTSCAARRPAGGPGLGGRNRFNYRGIGFDMTHDKFLHKFPTAKPTAPADAAGVISYAIDDLDRKADAVWFQFFDNEMYCIGFTYSNGRLQSNGGAVALLNKTKLQFGAHARRWYADLVAIPGCRPFHRRRL